MTDHQRQYPARDPGVCVLCGKERAEVFYHRGAEGTVCMTCYRWELQPRALCVVCGEHRPGAVRVSEITVVCPSCYANTTHRRRCRLCGALGKPVLKTENGPPICADCYRKKHTDTCAECGEDKPVAARLEAGALCHACAAKRRDPVAPCAACGEVRRLSHRDSRGRRICSRCYDRNVHVARCALCGARRTVASRTQDGLPVCRACYNAHLLPHAECSLCGTVAKVRYRTAEAEPVCLSCYREHVKPKETCCSCGAARAVAKRTPGGPLCAACYNRLRKEECALCGCVRRVAKRLDDGRAACPTCYKQSLQPREPCSSCGALAPVAARRDGRALCGPCYNRERRRGRPAGA